MYLNSKMAIEKHQLSLTLRVIQVLRVIIASIVRIFCSFYYGNEGEKIPRINDDILKKPAIEVAKKIRNKEITSMEVLESCIKRIKDVNSALNFLVEDRFELALKEANKADALIRSGTKTVEQLEKEQPLLGVPFTTKDAVGVKGLHLTAGVVLHKDVVADTDSEVIRLLKQKGAIIIGLTNVPEYCLWYESHNHLHGRTNNPYNTTRIVGGSSGGEGCCQAVAGSIFGIGSDIGGSIRMPAYFNGIFGHKPSRYAVSLDGHYPRLETDFQKAYATLGPMTRYASDLKPILSVIVGDKAPQLKLNEPVDVKKIKFYYQFNMDVPLTDAVDPDIIAAMKKVVEYLKVQHNIRAEEKKMALHESLDIWLRTTLNTPFGEQIMKNYSMKNNIIEIGKNAIGLSGNTLPALYVNLQISLERYFERDSDETLKIYSQKRDELEKMFLDFLGNDGVFLFPTHPLPAIYHNESLARPFNFIYTGLFNAVGLPATTVPLGLGSEGLPIGIQVVASHDNDRLCLAVAEELERAFGGWVEPYES